MHHRQKTHKHCLSSRSESVIFGEDDGEESAAVVEAALEFDVFIYYTQGTFFGHLIALSLPSLREWRVNNARGGRFHSKLIVHRQSASDHFTVLKKWCIQPCSGYLILS